MPDPNAARPSRRPPGFFASLFDFSFTTYATPVLVRVVYPVMAVLVAIAGVIWLIAAFLQAFGAGAVAGLAFTVIGLPIFVLAMVLQLAILRLFLEAALALTSAAKSLRNLEQR